MPIFTAGKRGPLPPVDPRRCRAAAFSEPTTGHESQYIGLGAYATNRDLRLTFKTLVGKAGISKEICDRLQNHALQDVSSKHYDRWKYKVEKRARMAKWDKFVRAMLAKKRLRSAG